MPKLQWMKWFPADWLNDTRQLSPESKGCWMDILMLMWNAPERGIWEGSFQDFARVTGLPWEHAPAVVRELHKVATVTFRNDCVTLENRRMRKQETHYKLNTDRQRRWRSNANNNRHVTAKTSQESLRLLKNTTSNDTVLASPEPNQTTPSKQQEWFDKIWAHYPPVGRIGKKLALKHFMTSVKDLETAKQCAQALDRYLTSKRVKGGFIQNGPTWFNNWQDWIHYVEEKDGTVNC